MSGPRVHIVNPNTTVAMTRTIGEAARRAAHPDTVLDVAQPECGPASIEGPYDDALAIPGLLQCIARAEAAGADAHVVACFDDTGLDASRALASAPVIGIGEAAFHVATLLGARFAVVTTLSRSVPVIEDNLERYGLARRCVGVRASDIPVLELDDPASNARVRIAAEVQAAIAEDGAEIVVLGCAGMADFAAALAAEFGVPVIEGISAAVTLAEGLARLGLKTSKAGTYAAPRPKPYAGMLAAWAPRGR